MNYYKLSLLGYLYTAFCALVNPIDIKHLKIYISLVNKTKNN